MLNPAAVERGERRRLLGGEERKGVVELSCSVETKIIFLFD